MNTYTDENMHSSKKMSKEDTWRPADLKRYIRVEENSDDYVSERRHRVGESKERQHRDPEKESRRERDKTREKESTRDTHGLDKRDKYVDQRKEGSRDRRDNNKRDTGDERDKQRRRDRERPVDLNKYSDDYREIRDKRRDREEKHDKERDKERQRDKGKERVKDKERYNEGDRDKRREERDKEKRREEKDREHRTERRRREESGELGRERTEKYDREQRDRRHERDRHKDEYEEKTNEKEKHELPGDRKHSERKREREYKEDHRKEKERERRHKVRGHREEKHHSESREHRDAKRSVEVRHHRVDREQAERDSHKERRHGEEEDPERKHRERRHREEEEEGARRNHRDRTISKKTSSSDTSHMHENNAVEAEVVLDEDFGDQEYEDDFEDYEEDFEEMDESENGGDDEKEPELPKVEEREELIPQKRKEIEAIQRAMEEENERALTSQSSPSTSREEEDRSKGSLTVSEQSKDSQRGKFIDFVAAKQREVSKKVATKQKKRSTELLRLIDLDFSMTCSLLDLPPLNEYDMYIRNFGSENTKQAYVQCNEDNADRDIQTENIEMCEKWTQHPPEHGGACGDPNLSQEARHKLNGDLNFNTQRLTSFLNSASQVMVVLLEEDEAERKSLRKLGTQTDTMSFSEGSLQLNAKLPFLCGRNISLVHFSQVQRHTMMSVHAPTTTLSSLHLDSCTIICIWNIWEPSRPQKILVYESEVQCCCFSTGKAILVFAGTSVGSVVLWDLREPASNHSRRKIGEEEWTFRQPTFSTDAVMGDSGHLSAVTSVEVVSSSVAGGLRPEVPLLASEEELSGLSFQLASLDEGGVLNFWVVVELPKANEAGSPTDLGLRPGSKIKLLHSSSLLTVDRVSPWDAVKTGPSQTVHLKFLPADSNHFFIGTNMGLVIHGTSHGLKAPPKFYSFQEPAARAVDVTAIHFSPFKPNMFLVGCGDGSIRLHGVRQEQPVAEWKSSTAGEPIVSLQWAQTRPTVFCVLDAASNLHIWDLLKNETKPVVTERMTADRVTALGVFGDSGQQNIYSGVALAHQSGKIEMQYFMSDFTVPITAEEEKLESMMTEAF